MDSVGNASPWAQLYMTSLVVSLRVQFWVKMVPFLGEHCKSPNCFVMKLVERLDSFGLGLDFGASSMEEADLVFVRFESKHFLLLWSSRVVAVDFDSFELYLSSIVSPDLNWYLE